MSSVDWVLAVLLLIVAANWVAERIESHGGGL